MMSCVPHPPPSCGILHLLMPDVEKFAMKKTRSGHNRSHGRRRVSNDRNSFSSSNRTDSLSQRRYVERQIEAAATAAAAAASESGGSLQFHTPIEPMRFLVVDDSGTSRKVLRHMLEKQLNPRHHVDEATDGAEAASKVQESLQNMNPYHGVFMDFEMPRLSGAAATERMRSLGYRNEIIIFTGLDNPDVESLTANGVTTILEKPLKLGQISKIVQGDQPW